MKRSNQLEQVAFNLDLLAYRLSRLEKIDSTDKSNQFEFLTFFDAVLVQFRAFFLERRRDNFTIQGTLEVVGKKEVADRLDDYLNEPFDDADEDCCNSLTKDEIENHKNSNNGAFPYRTLKTAIKTVTNKFICHYDSTTKLKLGEVNYISSVLSYAEGKRSLNNIIKDILNIVRDGLK